MVRLSSCIAKLPIFADRGDSRMKERQRAGLAILLALVCLLELSIVANAINELNKAGEFGFVLLIAVMLIGGMLFVVD